MKIRTTKKERILWLAEDLLWVVGGSTLRLCTAAVAVTAYVVLHKTTPNAERASVKLIVIGLITAELADASWRLIRRLAYAIRYRVTLRKRMAEHHRFPVLPL